MVSHRTPSFFRFRLPVHSFATAVLAMVVQSSVDGSAVVLHGVGDLPGGIISSEIRDATRVDGVIYAVGSSSAHEGSTVGDTAILWSSETGLKALPNLVNNDAGTTFVTASAITPDAAFIASRARSVAVGGARLAVRLTRNGFVNLNLGSTGTSAGNSGATAISADGSVLYGLGNGLSQAFRFTAEGPTATAIPFLQAGDTANGPAARGVSADGSVVVGTSSSPSSKRAYRYVHGAGVSALPLLPGGTWNQATAVSPDGFITLINGDSARMPAGEIYLHDARDGTIIRLGMMNEGWVPQNVAGMTSDGSVVVTTAGDPNPDGESYACFHNHQGWFQLTSAIAAGGVDLLASGWFLDGIFGVSADGTLVFGRGIHHGNAEGLVIEFPSNFLADFTAQPKTIANPAIVGAWTFGTAGTAIVFLPDGTFFEIQKATAEELVNVGTHGLERGTYTWDATTGAIRLVTQLDTNGGLGASGVSGALALTFKINGNTATLHQPAGGEGDMVFTRVLPRPGTLAGGWNFTSDPTGLPTEVVVFLPDGTYLQAQANPPGAQTSVADRPNGIEEGTYSWNPVTGTIEVYPVIDTNSDGGLSGLTPNAKFVLSPDQSTLTVHDKGQTTTAAKITEVRLVATANANGIVLAWPDHLTNYTVQAATDPAASQWATLTGTPTAEAGLLKLQLQATNHVTLFRLFKP